MLEIVIPEQELYDEAKQEFVTIESKTLRLEHSLVSISKWEAKWHKPFLSKDDKTNEEAIDYIRCMTIGQKVKAEIYNYIPLEVFSKIKGYIDDPMTATWFNEKPVDKKKSNETITSELIYYWMIAQNIPMECQKWHLNRLLTLIKVCSIKNKPPSKRKKKDIVSERRALNEARRSKLNSKG